MTKKVEASKKVSPKVIHIKCRFPFILIKKEDVETFQFKYAKINMTYKLSDVGQQYSENPTIEFKCEECLDDPELNFMQLKRVNKLYYKMVPHDPTFVSFLQSRYSNRPFTLCEDSKIKNQFNLP